jgi:hypothetical protein
MGSSIQRHHHGALAFFAEFLEATGMFDQVYGMMPDKAGKRVKTVLN